MIGGDLRRFYEKHGSSVDGFRFGVRLLISALVLLPGLWGVLIMIRVPRAAAFGFLIVAFDAIAVKAVFPTLWAASADWLRSDAHGRRISRDLDRELGNREPKPHRSITGEDVPPERW